MTRLTPAIWGLSLLLLFSLTKNLLSTQPSYPAGGYVSTGENLGSGIGNDGIIDGKIAVTLGSIAVTNANIGIQVPPTATNATLASVANPGGFNNYLIPTGSFNASDVDGNLDSMVITAFPTGANYLQVGTGATKVTYTAAGSTCPPQSTCTAFPATGGLKIPYAQVATLAVDPTATGNTSVTIPYYVIDNGSFRSPGTNNLVIPFTIPAPASQLSVSGNVWNDANGNGTLEAATEAFTNVAAPGQTLYALLVQTSNTYSGDPTVYASAPVTAGATGYTFSGVPAGNTYEVRIASLAAQPADGAALATITPALAPNYAGVSTNNSGTVSTNLNTVNPVNSLGTLTASKTGVNFGIELRPTVTPYTAAPQGNPGGNIQVPVPQSAFTGSDAEDGIYGIGLNSKTVTLTPGTGGTLYYNGIAVTAGGQTITSFNPALVTVDPTAAAGTANVTFGYSVNDAAGASSQPQTITVPFSNPITISGTVWVDANGNAVKEATGEPFTNAGGLNAVLTDASNNVIEVVAVNNLGAYAFTRSGENSTYNVILTTANPSPGTTASISTLPNPGSGQYVNTGVNQGTANAGNKTGVQQVTTTTVAVTNVNFGIEQRPTADVKAFTAPNAAFTYSTSNPLIGGNPSAGIAANSNQLSGSAVKSLSGTDPEDCASASSCSTGKTFQINTINANTLVYYNGVNVTAGSTIASFNIANLTIYGEKGQGFTSLTALGFTYSLVDAAGVASAPVVYSLQTGSAPLPIVLKGFAGSVSNCTASLRWEVASETANCRYEVEQSTTGANFKTVETVVVTKEAHNLVRQARITNLSPLNYFRLKLVDERGEATFSPTLLLIGGDCSSSAITVWPNPTANRVNVGGLRGTGNTIVVYSSLGAVVSKVVAHNATETVDLGNFAAGLYLIQVVSAEGNLLHAARVEKH